MSGVNFGLGRHENLWKRILRENHNALKHISNGDIGLLGTKSVDFRSTFSSREIALKVRSELKTSFGQKEDCEIFIINTDEKREQYDCVLSITLQVEVETITEVEHSYFLLSRKYGGGEVSWEFLNNDFTRH